MAGTAFRALSWGVFFGGPGGPGPTASELFWTLAIVTTAWLVTLVNLVLLAVNRLSLPTEDSVTPLRLGFLAQLLLMAGWALTFVFERPAAAKAAGYVLGGAGRRAPDAAWRCSPSPKARPFRGARCCACSHRRTAGWLVRMFGPGGGRGPGSVLILHWRSCWVRWRRSRSTPDDRRSFLASYGYLCFFVGVPTLAFRALLPKYATPLRLRVAILVALAAATALPDLLYYLIWQPELLEPPFSFRHLMSPLQTLANWRDR